MTVLRFLAAALASAALCSAAPLTDSAPHQPVAPSSVTTAIRTRLQAVSRQALALRAALFPALASAFAQSSSQAPTTARYADYGDNFKSYFGGGVNGRKFKFADGYSNGQPFNNGWRKSNHHVKNGVLSLDVKREQFKDTGSATGGWQQYPFTSGEIRSRGFHGVGCYATCMKPSGTSGISSSFYTHSGEHDIPANFHDSNPMHNEIDVEFVGKDTTKMQTNFFSRHKNPHANSASGVEEMHDLGFDAAKSFHVYGFKWTHDSIEWFVDGRPVRKVLSKEIRVPSPDYSPMRIVANTWPVNQQAEEWAGPLDKYFYQTSAQYRWMKFVGGAGCKTQSHC